MSSNNHILTVDIGTFSLKIAEFMYNNDELTLISFEHIEYGLNLEESEKIATIQNKFSSAIASKKFTAKKVYISVSGQVTFTRFVNLPPIECEEKKISQMVNYEAKQNIPFPIDEVTWDYQLITDSDKRNKEMKVMFTVIKTDIITEIINIFEQLRLETKLVETSLTATYNCISAGKLLEDRSIAVINIGYKCTSIVFADHDKFFFRTIPLGGHSITQQISKELKIPFEKAEGLKKYIGFVSLENASEEGDSELAKKVSKIIRNIMLKLYGEINKSINVFRVQQNGSKPTKILLSGGSSILKYTDQFLSGKLNTPVEYLNPFHLILVSKKIDQKKLGEIGHAFTEVIGLAVNSIISCPVEISLLPGLLKRKEEIKHKSPYFYVAGCAAIITLGIVYWGLATENKIVNDAITAGNKQIKSTQVDIKTLDRLKKTLQSKKTTYSRLLKMLDGRNKWFNLLDNIQKTLPDNTWIVQLSPTEKPTREQANVSGSLFRRKRKAENNKGKIGWVKIKAHTLVLLKNLKVTGAERFKRNLLASSFFTDNDDEIVITDFETTNKESDNIDTFNIIIKPKI